MKKLAIIIILTLTAVLYSCKSGDAVTTDADVKTAAISDTEKITENAVTYGEEWQFASLDKQILAEDENWSLTGKDFSYKKDYLGIFGRGYFDLANLNRIGDEENYVFEFEYLAMPDTKLGAYLNLLGIDSIITDEDPGITIVFGPDSISIGAEPILELEKKPGFRKISLRVDQTEKTVRISSDGEFCAKLVYESDGGAMRLGLYDAKGDPVCEKTKNAPLYAGGMIKLRAENCGVYLKNVAFRID